MTDDEVNIVLDEIAPKSERGNYKIGTSSMLSVSQITIARGLSEDHEKLGITKIGSTNEYRYVSVIYHSSQCKQLDIGKKDRTP